MAMPDSNEIWGQSGLYLARPRSKRLVRIDLDLRRNHNVLLVNCDDLKVGEARNFLKRRQNYEKTFADNVDFFLPFIISPDFHEAEKVAKATLSSFRIPNPHTNRRGEWLTDIEPLNAIQLVEAALRSTGIPYQPVDVTGSL